jgi:hypothetical protein
MPPAGGVGLPRQRQQRLPLDLVADAVQREEVDDIAFLESNPAQLEPAHLRLGGTDRVAGRAARDAGGLA